MRKHILKVANQFLQPFGAKLIRKNKDSDLSMNSMIQRLTQRDVIVQTVVDIGASDGKWSTACMKYLPNASYIAIEPLEERREALENAKLGLSNFDYVLCVAGSSDGEKIRLNVTPDLDGSTVEGQGLGSSRTCFTSVMSTL